jgi:hypothetical protein
MKRDMVADIVEYHFRWKDGGRPPGPPPKTVWDRENERIKWWALNHNILDEMYRGKSYSQAIETVAKASWNTVEIKSRRSKTDRSGLARWMATLRKRFPKKFLSKSR